MSRLLFASALISLAVGAEALSQVPSQAVAQQSSVTSQRKIPCKVPENASMCYWTHGRLVLTTGWSAWQLWKIGTNRVSLIYSGPKAFPARTEEQRTNPEFPANLEKAYEAEIPRLEKIHKAIPDWVYGDFEVCPLESERPGQAQASCIESAKNILFDGSKKIYP